MATFVDKGITLRKIHLGEGDLLLDILTSKRGRITALARGALKLTSRKRGNIEVGAITHFRFEEGKSKYVVVEAEMEDGLLFLRGIQQGLQFIWDICNISFHLLKSNEEFGILEYTLRSTNTLVSFAEKKKGVNYIKFLKLAKTWFLLNVLVSNGFIQENKEMSKIIKDFKNGILILKDENVYRKVNNLTGGVMHSIM